MLPVVKRVVGLPFQDGGEEHTGWLPAGAAMPLPTPLRNVIIDLEIQFDGSGYLLCFSARDGSMSGDTWHESLSQAEQAALECFGIEPVQWQSP